MDKDFHDLLTRYVRGQCKEEEIARINEWYDKIADRELDLDDNDKSVIQDRMRANLVKELPGLPGQGGRPSISMRFPLLKVAAAVAVIVVCGVVISSNRQLLKSDIVPGAMKPSNETVIANETAEIQAIHLPDGSTVRLEPSAKIVFTRTFSESSREVFLTGRASFFVEKDPARPFYVYSETIATRVLGTSFVVDAPAGAKKVEVNVMTGKVSVFQVTDKRPSNRKGGKTKNSAANGVVLSPNQKVEYFIEEGHWVTGLVEDPLPVRPLNKETISFVFADTPMKTVLEDINERYGIEVITGNEKIYDCTFTGDVSALSLYDMLDIVSTSIGSTYEVKGTRILLSGNGCY